jgi:hopene-associated glycosyltransferase HpnB
VPFLAAAAISAAAIWIYLLAGHGGYWRTDQRLPSASSAPSASGASSAHSPREARWPRVVAVIPARDEAAMLPLTLPALLAQDYPGGFRVVLVDDCSSDGTAAVAAEIAAGPADGRVRVLAGQPRPAGWAGKVWAMEQGIRSAADGDYLLLTDADIAYEPAALTALVQAAEAGRYDLVSQMALLRARTSWERILVPAFVYFFAQLYPFRRVNSPGGRTAAAAGGCMLVRRQALAGAGGLERIRGALIDDVALGRLLKRSGGRCWLGFSTRVISRRPYPELAELWGMVTRSAYYQLRYSPVLLAATIIGLLWIYAVPPTAALAGVIGTGTAAALSAAAGLTGWAIMSATYVPMLRLYRLSPLRAPGLPLIAAMYAAMTIDSARRHRAGRGGAWKGRTANDP